MPLSSTKRIKKFGDEKAERIFRFLKKGQIKKVKFIQHIYYIYIYIYTVQLQ